MPLLIDLANPSPATGPNNKERISFIERTNCDLGLALALVHHLAIGKNIPFEKIAELFKNLADHFIIEFIPKTDKKVKFMLQQKKIFTIITTKRILYTRLKNIFPFIRNMRSAIPAEFFT